MRYEVIVYGGNIEEIDRTAEIISADRAIAFIEAYEKLQKAAQQCVHPTPPTARSISVTCPKCGTFIGVDFANTAGG